jgi:hypothetical protein
MHKRFLLQAVAAAAVCVAALPAAAQNWKPTRPST